MRIKNNQAGLTLIEILVSISLIGLIIIVFIPLFIMSADTNNKTETTLDATYLGVEAMELVYELSQTIPFEELKNNLLSHGFTVTETNNTYSYEYSDKKNLIMKFTKDSNNLVNVLVKIYTNKELNQLEVQFESYYSWRGDSGE